MKKISIALLFLFLFSFAFAGIGIERHNLPIEGTGAIGVNLTSGLRIYAKENVSIYNISFASSMTGDIVRVLNETGGINGNVDKIINESRILNKASQINVSLVAGQYYTISVTNRSGSWTEADYGNIGTTLPASIFPLAGRVIDWVNGSRLNATFGSPRNVETIYLRDNYFNINQSNYNYTSYETSLESFTSNVTSASAVSSAKLFYNGTNYTATVSSLGNNLYQLTRTIDVPTFINAYSGAVAYWNLVLANGTNVQTTNVNQYNYLINYSICGASPQNILFYNITFKNETPSQERVNASIPSSTWVYWLGSGGVNKTMTYTTTTENKEYDFCFSPPSKRVNVQPSVSYDNSESEQRTYSPVDYITLSNTTTLRTLFLLPSTQGQYVTFQVINLAQQVLQGVNVEVTRSGIGVIELGTTEASGSVTFFLNPSFAYNFVFSKDGFEDYSTTITPTQTAYTVTLGGDGQSTNVTNPSRGISYLALPQSKILQNGTTYNFNLTLSSDYWTLDSWGFTLTNKSGYVFDTESSTANGGFLSSNLNTVENTTILMNYFWVINGQYNNATIVWTVINLEDSEASISQFFTDLQSYVSVGLFGLTEFGLTIIIFFVIFIATGIMSYKFGINSPATILGFAFALVLLFDVGLGLIPNPVNAIPHAVSFILGLILVGMIIREFGR